MAQSSTNKPPVVTRQAHARQAPKEGWRRYYRVDIFPGQTYTRLRIQKRSGRDGITWDVLQQIKNDVLGEDVWAIEIFPPTSELVNEINARHLWTWAQPSLPNLAAR